MSRVPLQLNGQSRTLEVDPRRTLLDAVRIDCGLTGTKKSCDMGNCGACTVLVDGRAIYACLALTVDCAGASVTTIEGLADDPLQHAFVAADALQCGFCTPGQIMSLKALFNETATPSEEQILRAVSGNLCRCGAYRNILRAAKLVAQQAK